MTGLRSVAIANRRNSPRLSARVSIGLQIESQSHVEMSQTRDFSANGVFVETKSDIAIGTTVELYFMPPGTHQSLRLIGAVARRAEDGIGITFNPLSPQQRTALDRFLASLEPRPLPPADQPVPDEYRAENIEAALQKAAERPENPQQTAERIHAVARKALESERWPQAAIALLERAIELSPYVAAYHHDLGTALYRTGDIARAVAELDKALWLEPEKDDE